MGGMMWTFENLEGALWFPLWGESSTRCNFRKHMQIEKAPANQENIFITLTADGAKCSQHKQIHFICSSVSFLVVL